MKLDKEQIVTSRAVKLDEDREWMEDASTSEHTTLSDDRYESYAMIVNEYGKHAAHDHFDLQRKHLVPQNAHAVEEEMMKDMEKHSSAVYQDPVLRAVFERKWQQKEEDAMEVRQQMLSARKRMYDAIRVIFWSGCLC